MNARVSGAVAGVALSVATVAGAPAALTHRAETSLYVTVESHGIPVRGLTAADFAVLQDGEPVAFRVAPAEQPAHVMVLVENTVRARRFFESDIQMALGSLSAIAADHDEYALASFERRFAVTFGFGPNIGRLGRAYQRDVPQPIVGEPALWDAMVEAVDRLDTLPGRRVLIVVTTGDDASPQVTARVVRDRVRESNIVVFVCGVGTDLRMLLAPDVAASPRIPAGASEFELRTLAVSTGGAAWFPPAHGVADAMANLVRRIDDAYRIVYDPVLRPGAMLHPITVRAWGTSATDLRTPLTVVAKDAWRVPLSESEE